MRTSSRDAGSQNSPLVFSSTNSLGLLMRRRRVAWHLCMSHPFGHTLFSSRDSFPSEDRRLKCTQMPRGCFSLRYQYRVLLFTPHHDILFKPSRRAVDLFSTKKNVAQHAEQCPDDMLLFALYEKVSVTDLMKAFRKVYFLADTPANCTTGI